MWWLRSTIMLVYVLAAAYAPPVAAQVRSIVRYNAIGCQDWNVYKTIIQYPIFTDREVFNRAFTSGLFNGECTLFAIGETVDTVVSSFTSIKLRRLGSTAAYWTALETVMPPK